MPFFLLIYTFSYVQYANTTLGPYSRTALHHTPPRTLWSRPICDVRTFLSLSLTYVAPKQPGLESSRLRCLGRPSTDGIPSYKFHYSGSAERNNRHRVDQAVTAFHWRAIDQWRRRLQCVVQQQGGHIEHFM